MMDRLDRLLRTTLERVCIGIIPTTWVAGRGYQVVCLLATHPVYVAPYCNWLTYLLKAVRTQLIRKCGAYILGGRTQVTPGGENFIAYRYQHHHNEFVVANADDASLVLVYTTSTSFVYAYSKQYRPDFYLYLLSCLYDGTRIGRARESEWVRLGKATRLVCGCRSISVS